MTSATPTSSRLRKRSSDLSRGSAPTESTRSTSRAVITGERRRRPDRRVKEHVEDLQRAVERLYARADGAPRYVPDALDRAARHSDRNSVPTTARGISHHTDSPAELSAAVSPIATAMPTATRQSSPTMNSYQKRANATSRVTRALPPARRAAPAARARRRTTRARGTRG